MDAPLTAADFTGPVRPLMEKAFDDGLHERKYSDLVNDRGHQYVDLVTGGGGVPGIALVGYTWALEELGLRFRGIGGTSAGSINALALAAARP